MKKSGTDLNKVPRDPQREVKEGKWEIKRKAGGECPIFVGERGFTN